MKLQSLGIIFVIIVMPMILIISYYLGLQIDSLTLRNKYENSLIDATNDAMNAFELNTANEELSNISDSLRTIVQASTNIFFNTFATSIGVSNANKNTIQPYIPAMLYTLYDGYYIYAPTKTPIILERVSPESGDGLVTVDGALKIGDKGVVLKSIGKYRYDPSSSTELTNDSNYGSMLYKIENEDAYSPEINDDTKFKTDYVLKSFMPYSATYKNGNDEVTINYTLDNFISVSGTIGSIYYTKSGYYIDENLLKTCTISNWINKGQDELKEICEGSSEISITLDIGSGITIVSNMNYDTGDGNIPRTLKELEDYLAKVKRNNPGSIGIIRDLEVKIANRKAVMYYVTNTVFSKWANSKLNTLVTGDHLVSPPNIVFTLDNGGEIYHNFAGENNIFSNTADPEQEDSRFNNHRYNIIKNSIKYNLNIAVSSYDSMMEGLSFAVPELDEEEWRVITEKLSIVAFAQGLDCGLEDLSTYAVVSSTNNEITVIPEEIYYVPKNNFNNENSYYHRLDCPNFDSASEYISFKSKEVKYDDVYEGDTTGLYSYDHKNYACYDCIINNNYYNYHNGAINMKTKLRSYLGLENEIEYGINYRNTSPNTNLQKAYLTALAKERQNLYKTTAYSKNEGIRVFDEPSAALNFSGDRFKAEITIKVQTPDPIVPTANVLVGGASSGAQISTSQQSTQTVKVYAKDLLPSVGGAITIDNSANIKILSIKYVYK